MSEGVFAPMVAYNSPGIDLPIQHSVELLPGERTVIDTCIKFFIPANFYGQIQARSSCTKLDIWVHSGVIDNDYGGTIKLAVKNCNKEKI